MIEGQYDPKKVEERIYKLWEDSGFFNPDAELRGIDAELYRINADKPELKKNLRGIDADKRGKKRKPFTIMLPPPNVTGILHMGSALMVTIEDIMIRYKRMQGFKTLWLPGVDHAAIATETKFLKEKKLSRSDFNDKRDEFIKMVDEFAMANKNAILNQMRAMGASLDWSRLAYTLDETRSKAVQKAFIDMYDAGLIYLGTRVINWDPRGQTGVSDDEMEHEPRKATLYYFKYWKDFPIVVATTQPETKVGDIALAVHPSDKRYKQYIGKEYSGSFVGKELRIKIVGDESVDPEFGTGALGVTPAHSHIDSNIATKNNLIEDSNDLNYLQVINEIEQMLPSAGPLLDGKKTKEAREIIIQWLRDHKLIVKEEEIDQNAPRAQRSGGMIRELPKRDQFFVNVNKPIKNRGNKTLKQLMKEAVVKKKVVILPDRFKKIYLHWIENLRDWNISRQIWYGHRIPAWYQPLKPRLKGQIADLRVQIEKPDGDEWEQFSDTLDTWFSSGLWSFSTLGWPEKTKDLKEFFPTDVVESGYDILFFWIARMILMSEFFMGEAPFSTVYLHGLVRDEQNRKISKSLGNNIDPVDMIDQYGADAVRMAMIIGTSVGSDSKVSPEKFKAYKHFANKMWNASKFVLININTKQALHFHTSKYRSAVKLTVRQRKQLKEFQQKIKRVTKLMDEYKFYLAGEELYHYFWHTFCDKVIEECKKSLLPGASKKERQATQYMILEILLTSLKLLHPFMPFITEEIYQELPIKDKKKSLMVEQWPV